MIKVGIVGATGYTGVELLRLLARHPHVEIAIITSRAEAGMLVSEMFPSLRGVVDLPFCEPNQSSLTECDLVFFATPNGVAMRSAPELVDAGVKVIDLAADFRLKDPQEWQEWYGEPHACPELLAEAVYGLCEEHREAIANARIVANPGCYPTAVQLGLIPLLKTGLADYSSLIADCKSGVSGAGRKANVNTLLCEASENFQAYAVSGHRHLPEIRQELQRIVNQTVNLTFVPHLTPMARGIFATLYVKVLDRSVDLQALFEQHYRDEPFVDVLPAGGYPQTRSVRGANQCRLAIHRPQDGDTVVVLSVIDNLVKGAAGQAVQNMNIMFGWEESSGLDNVALIP